MLIPGATRVGDMSDGAAPLPEATYNLRISKAQYVATPKSKDAKGPYIKCECTVTGPGDGPHVGRKVFQNYSLSGDGSFRLKELLKVTGHNDDFELTDDQDLVNLEFGAVVGIQEGTGGYPDRNQIKRHVELV